MGPFISTFYCQSEECPSSSDKSTSFEPIGESELQDNSLLLTSDKSRDQPVAMVTNHGNDSTTEKGASFSISPNQSPPKHTSPGHNSSTVSVFQTDKKTVSGLSKTRGETPQDEFGLFQFWRVPIPIYLPETGTSPDSHVAKNKNQSSPPDINKTLPGKRPGDVVTGDIGDMGIPDDDMTGDNSVFREGEGEECDDYRGDLTDIKDELLAESAEMEDKGSKAFSEGVSYTDSGTTMYPQVSNYLLLLRVRS